jgi:hypothetical protein
MGHKLSGFFSVKRLVKMEMIYCDFFANQNGIDMYHRVVWLNWSNYFLLTDKQKWIGYVDVKSTPVHFYVQRNFYFKKIGSPIPFDLAVVNEGNAMNLTSGIFTASRPGIYFLSFTGLAQFQASSSVVYLSVGLYLNGSGIGACYVQESNTVAYRSSPLTLQSTLNLKKDDQVWVAIIQRSTGIYLHDTSNYHHTHFTGFMLEEEIVASLWGFCFDYSKMIVNWSKNDFFIAKYMGNGGMVEDLIESKVVKGWVF